MSAEQKHAYLGIDANRVIAAFLKLHQEATTNPDTTLSQSLSIIQQELLVPTIKVGPEEIAQLRQILTQQES